MRQVSERFQKALRTNATWIVKADVMLRGELIAEDLPISGGAVTVDRHAETRSRLTLQVFPDDVWLPDSFGLVNSVANEIRISCGFRFSDGTDELVPVGIFKISRPTVSDDGIDLTFNIDAYDRSRTVKRARFTDYHYIASGTLVHEAIRNLIQMAIPWLQDNDFLFIPATERTPALVFEPGEDPWRVGLDLAASIGCELYFDGDGKAVLRQEPDPVHDPVVAVYEAGELGTMVSVVKDLDDSYAYNGVVVISENSDIPAPIRAAAWDLDPHSPTYYDPLRPEASAYGPVPYFMKSQYITTQQQATDAARANLLRVINSMEEVEITMFTNPAHEAGDIIAIKRDRARIDAVNVMESFSFDLSAQGTMTARTRRRRAPVE